MMKKSLAVVAVVAFIAFIVCLVIGQKIAMGVTFVMAITAFFAYMDIESKKDHR